MLPNWIYYFLGKKSGGGGDTPTPTGTKFKLINGMKFAYSELTSFPESFSESVDISELTNCYRMFYNCTIDEAPLFDTSNVTNMKEMFYQVQHLKTIPPYNTSKVTNFDNFLKQNTFSTSTTIENVPVFDMSGYTSTSYADMANCFGDSIKLTDESLDNILQSLLSVRTLSSSQKQLSRYLSSYSYYSERIQTLPHYQDFINAGWTIS